MTIKYPQYALLVHFDIIEYHEQAVGPFYYRIMISSFDITKI